MRDHVSHNFDQYREVFKIRTPEEKSKEPMPIIKLECKTTLPIGYIVVAFSNLRLRGLTQLAEGVDQQLFLKRATDFLRTVQRPYRNTLSKWVRNIFSDKTLSVDGDEVAMNPNDFVPNVTSKELKTILEQKTKCFILSGHTAPFVDFDSEGKIISDEKG